MLTNSACDALTALLIKEATDANQAFLVLALVRPTGECQCVDVDLSPEDCDLPQGELSRRFLAPALAAICAKPRAMEPVVK